MTFFDGVKRVTESLIESILDTESMTAEEEVPTADGDPLKGVRLSTILTRQRGRTIERVLIIVQPLETHYLEDEEVE